jgi:hypothetical protein
MEQDNKCTVNLTCYILWEWLFHTTNALLADRVFCKTMYDRFYRQETVVIVEEWRRYERTILFIWETKIVPFRKCFELV